MKRVGEMLLCAVHNILEVSTGDTALIAASALNEGIEGPAVRFLSSG